MYDRVHEYGPKITIRFKDASGLKAGGTQITYRGVEINVESFRALVAGGIAFATPDDPKDKPAKAGSAFPLNDKPKKEWLAWAPKIPIPPESP